ncbi:MAG: zinc-binding dehydrogenase, partial [Acidimicrobiia bacterium]
SKLDLAKQFGATELIDASAGDPVQQVRDATGGGVDYAFEAIGMKVTAEQAWGMTGRGGTATVIGMIPIGETVELPGFDFLSEKKIQGSLMGSNRFRIDMPRYIDFYLAGKLKLDELVSDRIKLEQVNDGFTALSSGEIARDVIVFDS